MKFGSVKCPTCRDEHKATSASHFPVSFIAEEFVKEIKAIKLLVLSEESAAQEEATELDGKSDTEAKPQTRLGVISERLKTLLDEQKNSVFVWLQNGEHMYDQMNKYSIQLGNRTEQHVQHLEKLHNMSEKKRNIVQSLRREQTKVKNMIDEGFEVRKELTEVLKVFDDVKLGEEVGPAIDQSLRCIMELKKWKQMCQVVFPHSQTIHKSRKEYYTTKRMFENLNETEALWTITGSESKVRERYWVEEGAEAPAPLSIPEKLADMITLQGITVEDLMERSTTVDMLMRMKQTFCIQEDYGGIRSSMLSLEDGRIHVHCLTNNPPPLNTTRLPIKDLMKMLDLSSTLVFLDLSWPVSIRRKRCTTTRRRRVYIRLGLDSTYVREFVVLCTGVRGYAYLNTNFNKVVNIGTSKEYVVAGDYDLNTGMGGSSIMYHMPVVDEQPQHQRVYKQGTVLLKHCEFIIVTGSGENRGLCGQAIGQVESGMSVLREAVSRTNIRDVAVLDCGFVLPNP
ncbi:hypothetical protein Pcinc_032854 [Petrolisthes cinctipes]|uniref:Uncharacterized protein n=1 Tax=Petrolisthes cinctipes TaxID=88211 RepID=A0AAE1ET88_PETCI|nr:hypothetical protein Pcinc_032854 [Petrolisthes cinctipes]